MNEEREWIKINLTGFTDGKIMTQFHIDNGVPTKEIAVAILKLERLKDSLKQYYFKVSQKLNVERGTK